MLVEFTLKKRNHRVFFFPLENLNEIDFENEKTYVGTETWIDISLNKIKFKLTIMFTEELLERKIFKYKFISHFI